MRESQRVVRRARRLLGLAWSELLVPVLVAAGLFFIAVALIEGSPLEPFLYAVF
ncbi:MAG: hypothetical protein HY812_09880 [Planctomycetes bacterium]|nr:hypothetical protein [Planctomycetota bacterium]